MEFSIIQPHSSVMNNFLQSPSIVKAPLLQHQPLSHHPSANIPQVHMQPSHIPFLDALQQITSTHLIPIEQPCYYQGPCTEQPSLLNVHQPIEHPSTGWQQSTSFTQQSLVLVDQPVQQLFPIGVHPPLAPILFPHPSPTLRCLFPTVCHPYSPSWTTPPPFISYSSLSSKGRPRTLSPQPTISSIALESAMGRLAAPIDAPPEPFKAKHSCSLEEIRLKLSQKSSRRERYSIHMWTWPSRSKYVTSLFFAKKLLRNLKLGPWTLQKCQT